MIRKKTRRTGRIVVDLAGPDGNAFALLGMAKSWAEQIGLDWDAIKEDAMSGDYEHLLDVLDTHFGTVVIFER